MTIFSFEGKNPEIDPSAYVHPEATIIGEVTIGANCYVGAGARLRGDWGAIVIQEGSNIQENVVIHSAPSVTTVIGENSHVGHGAIVHGAKVGPGTMIGMGAILHEEVEIGPGCIIGSGAVIPGPNKIPAGKLVVGVPAKVVGDVSPALKEEQRKGIALYQQLPARMKQGLERE